MIGQIAGTVVIVERTDNRQIVAMTDSNEVLNLVLDHRRGCFCCGDQYFRQIASDTLVRVNGVPPLMWWAAQRVSMS